MRGLNKVQLNEKVYVMFRFLTQCVESIIIRHIASVIQVGTGTA